MQRDPIDAGASSSCRTGMTTRKHGTTGSGGSFSEATKKEVWEKGEVVPGVDKNVKRKDAWGAWIEWKNYGDTTPNGTGWEIDHKKPVAKGGTDDPSNLQPLQWQNNRSKADDWPNWTGKVKAKAN
ncbi:MAG: HNH endonuclease signature motif containing protein [Polyangiaceae bacterium]